MHACIHTHTHVCAYVYMYIHTYNVFGRRDIVIVVDAPTHHVVGEIKLEFITGVVDALISMLDVDDMIQVLLYACILYIYINLCVFDITDVAHAFVSMLLLVQSNIHATSLQHHCNISATSVQHQCLCRTLVL
jgi:hypothetical protein